MIKAVKFKHVYKTGGGNAISIPKIWLKELEWDMNTKLVLEYHPYKKEILVMEDYRNVSTMKSPKEKKEEKIAVEIS